MAVEEIRVLAPNLAPRSKERAKATAPQLLINGKVADVSIHTSSDVPFVRLLLEIFFAFSAYA